MRTKLDLSARFRNVSQVPQRSSHLNTVLAQLVERWFRANARDLPWRRTKDPYAIWISEVMLQQTQVKTVIPYWERWMERFPNVTELAEAAEEAVLKAWEGLGYYTRARNLQRAAKMICGEFNGTFPTEFEQVLQLAGIGRYTAGAICSIAFGKPTAILDGNVARVLSRLFVIGGVIKDPSTQKQLWARSEALVQAASDCSALNQGLMELGATVCLPRSPLCTSCPLARQCKARQQGMVENFPEPPKQVIMRERQFLALIFQRKGRVLVRKRDAAVVNGGLWEFPNFELESGQDGLEQLNRFKCDLKLVRTIKHTITRNRITLRAFAGEPNGNANSLARELKAEWRTPAELQTLPFSSAHARLRTLVHAAQ